VTAHDRWIQALRDVFAHRRCILVGGVFVASRAAVTQLLRLGAEPPVLVVCPTLGHGPLPDPTDAVPLVVDGTQSVSTIATIRAFEQRLADPTPTIVDALDDLDPHGSAMVLGSPFASSDRLAGRRRFGHRRPEWAAFEDKTRSAGLLARVSPVALPVEIVANRADVLRESARRVDRGHGAVASGACLSIPSRWTGSTIESSITLADDPDPDRWDLRLEAAAMPGGVHVRLVPNPDTTPVGVAVAPRVAAGFQAADELHQLGIGRLTAQAPVDSGTRPT